MLCTRNFNRWRHYEDICGILGIKYTFLLFSLSLNLFINTRVIPATALLIICLKFDYFNTKCVVLLRKNVTYFTTLFA